MGTSDLHRILYVEDEPDIQAVARLALETLGRFEVATCNTGEEALREAPRFRPDLVLLDVMMPGLDGPATLRALRAVPEFATTPAIFMTAKVQPHEVAELKQLGAIYVIDKPFDPMTLASQVRELWRQWHER